MAPVGDHQTRYNNKGEGVSFDQITNRVNTKDVDKIINSLLERGEIFELTPGKYKVLE